MNRGGRREMPYGAAGIGKPWTGFAGPWRSPETRFAAGRLKIRTWNEFTTCFRSARVDVSRIALSPRGKRCEPQSPVRLRPALMFQVRGRNFSVQLSRGRFTMRQSQRGEPTQEPIRCRLRVTKIQNCFQTG